MTDLEAIGQRISRRTYIGTPIAQEEAALLTAAVAQENQRLGLSAAFVEDGGAAFQSMGKTYGMFKGIRSLFVLKGDKRDAHLREKTGYLGERLVLESTKLGLGTCWVGGTFDSKSLVLCVGEEEELTCVITVGNVQDENSFMENLVRKATHLKTKPLEALYTAGTPVPDWFLRGMQAVQKAPSSINSQKFHFTYAGGAVTAAVPDTYRFDLVDLGIAKLNFELGAGGEFALGNGAGFTKTEQ